MTTQISCAYKATATGAKTAAALTSALSLVGLDNGLLNLYGLRVLSDSSSTPGGGSFVATRTTVLGMNPSVAATATANLDSTGRIPSVTVTAGGSDYVIPPVVTVPPAASTTSVARLALLHATLGVNNATVSNGGGGYTGATVVTFSGGQLAPGGKQATGTVTLAAGVVVAVTISTQGGPYLLAPIATVSDTGGGSGAVIAVHLGLTGIVVDNPGSGYTAAPAVTITPVFHAYFPDTGDQVAPLSNWMTEVLQLSLIQPVVAVTPVVS